METKSIRDNAVSFKQASERCLEARNLSSVTFQMLVVPAVVNIAFSAELFLKFLIASKGVKIKSHNLLDLYSSLEELTKSEIVNLTSYKREEFEQILKIHSELFVEWRYVHERFTAKADLRFMKQFVDSLEINANKISIK
jgi:hypothetical protein